MSLACSMETNSVPSPAFYRRATTGMVDQDSTHDLGGNAEEVRLVLPIHLALIGEPEVCLVDEGRGAQGSLGRSFFSCRAAIRRSSE